MTSLPRPIRDQALAAAEEAAVILFVVDGRTRRYRGGRVGRPHAQALRQAGLSAGEQARQPRSRERQHLGVLFARYRRAHAALGAARPRGTGDLLDDIVALLPEEEDEVADEFPDALNVAIIGRPNAGKSSLFNRILGADRSIVSNIAGIPRVTPSIHGRRAQRQALPHGRHCGYP